MKEQKIIIVSSMNLTPEDELNERLEKLGDGWKIVGQPQTTIALQGEMDTAPTAGGSGLFYGVAHHVYMVTTVVVEKLADPKPKTKTVTEL